jgi:hypothetical protein
MPEDAKHPYKMLKHQQVFQITSCHCLDLTPKRGVEMLMEWKFSDTIKNSPVQLSHKRSIYRPGSIC